MTESAQWLRERGRRTVGRHYVDRERFITAADLPANRKVELDWPRKGSEFFKMTTQAIGEWVVDRGIAALTAVPDGATRYAEAAASELELPFVGYEKLGSDFVFAYDRRNGASALRDSSLPLGIVEDVRSTGLSMLKLATAIGNWSIEGLAIVDRGLDVPDVTTIDEARRYTLEHPDQPPAHIALPFACTALINYPLPLSVENG